MVKYCVALAVINSDLNLSSALFLHSKSMLEEQIEIIAVVVLLMRCLSLSQPLSFVITFNEWETEKGGNLEPPSAVRHSWTCSVIAAASSPCFSLLQGISQQVSKALQHAAWPASDQTRLWFDSLNVFAINNYSADRQAHGKTLFVIWSSFILKPVWFLAPTPTETSLSSLLIPKWIYSWSLYTHVFSCQDCLLVKHFSCLTAVLSFDVLWEALISVLHYSVENKAKFCPFWRNFPVRQLWQPIPTVPVVCWGDTFGGGNVQRPSTLSLALAFHRCAFSYMCAKQNKKMIKKINIKSAFPYSKMVIIYNY